MFHPLLANVFKRLQITLNLQNFLSGYRKSEFIKFQNFLNIYSDIIYFKVFLHPQTFSNYFIALKMCRINIDPSSNNIHNRDL